MTAIEPRLGLRVPKTWHATSFGELCDKYGGALQTGPFGSQLHSSDYTSEGTPVVMPQDLRGGRIVTDNVARVDDDHVERLAHHKLLAGDIVYSRRGDVTRFAIVQPQNEGWLCGTGCLRIRPAGAPLDSGYARWFLEHPALRKWLLDQAKGATMPNLNTTILSELPLVLPPLPEQKRIAAILDKADAIRRKRQEAIRLTEELLRSAFLEMFGDPVTNPKGWEVRRLGEIIADTQLGLVRAAAEQHPNGEYEYIRMDSIRRDGLLDLGGLTRVNATPAEAAKCCLRRGDLLFNTRNTKELVGKTAVYRGDGSHMFNNNIMRIRLMSGVAADYVNRYLLSPLGQRELERRKSGTTSVFAIYYKQLATMPVLLPPEPLQLAYSAAVDEILSARARLREHNELLSELGAALTICAFSGRLLD